MSAAETGCLALVAGVLVGVWPPVVAQGQACAPIAEGGYAVTRCQTTTKPSHDSVGWRKTDRESRVGNTPETDGNSSTFVLVVGTFAKKCPTADGKVAGTFESSVTKDEVDTDVGETKRTHFANRLLARLEGQVKDDGMLEFVEIEGEVTRERDGTPTERIVLPRQRFTPGRGGEPDWEAMRRAVEATGDLSPATAILYSGATFLSAELEWQKPITQCVELAFDPPTETRSLGPNESAEVRAVLRTMDGKVSIDKGRLGANPLNDVGRVTPTPGETPADLPFTFTYTASAQPRKGHGFDVATLSRAGAASAKWQIHDLAKYEGVFTYNDLASGGSGVGLFDDDIKMTGHLVWTPEEGKSPSVPSFSDVQSKFYRPGAGEITIEIGWNIKGLAGSSCRHDGRKTFPIESLAQNALRYMLLEIADDGRYQLTLAIPDSPDPFPTWAVEAVCNFPGGATAREVIPVHSLAVAIGKQQGQLNADHGVVGRLMTPIRRGPRTITGNWSFARVQPQ